MAHFAVTHLTFWQAHGQTRGFNQAFGVVGPELIEHRLVRGGDSVVFRFFRVAEAIENEEHSRFFWGCHSAITSQEGGLDLNAGYSSGLWGLSLAGCLGGFGLYQRVFQCGQFAHKHKMARKKYKCLAFGGWILGEKRV